MWLACFFLVTAAQPLEPVVEPAPPTAVAVAEPPVTTPEAEGGDAPLALAVGAALDVSAADLWATPSARVDLLYELPLPVGLHASLGLRTGYSYRAGKGGRADDALGVDPAAYFSAHGIPVYGLAAASYGSGRESALFVVPLRVGIYAGLGGQLLFGEAHAFGSTKPIAAFAPTAVVGGGLEIEQTPSLRYVLFTEWESALLRDLPGGDRDLSALRVGLSLRLSFGS